MKSLQMQPPEVYFWRDLNPEGLHSMSKVYGTIHKVGWKSENNDVLFVAVDLNKGPLNQAACPTEVDLHVVREGRILAWENNRHF